MNTARRLDKEMTIPTGKGKAEITKPAEICVESVDRVAD
jgi:hypothetical protein